jgi:hypothetical protein
MSEAHELNVYQRLNKVRATVGYLHKDKEVAGRYKAVTHDSVTAAVRGPFIEHGIMVVPSIENSAMVKSDTLTAKGIPIWRFEARFKVSFVNIDKPDDRIDIILDSHALDEGDKAPGKATSYAVKYAMLKLLSIETGEEEEERVTQVKSNGAARAGAWESLSQKRQGEIADLMTVIRDALQENETWKAYEEWVSAKERFFQSPEEEIAAWGLLDSSQRRAMKELHKAEQSKQKGKQ